MPGRVAYTPRGTKVATEGIALGQQAVGPRFEFVLDFGPSAVQSFLITETRGGKASHIGRGDVKKLRVPGNLSHTK